MYKQSVRASAHSFLAGVFLWIFSLCLLSVMKHAFLHITASQYDTIENILIVMNALFVLWLFVISRSEYVYQLIDRDLIIKKVRGSKETVKCTVAAWNIQSIRPISGVALMKSWWMRSIGFCGNPLAIFSGYVLTYKTANQKYVTVVFQPNRELLSHLSELVGDKLEAK